MKPRLLFVSPRFLFPVDSGGKIRTTQILRGMKGGRFHIVLASPGPADAATRYASELAAVADEFNAWAEPERGPFFVLNRLRWLASADPIPVMSDRSEAGSRLVRSALDARPDVVVFDFPHSAVLGPERLTVPSVLFTHNVEAEIFARHEQVVRDVVRRSIWRSQHRKMRDFEARVLRRFDRVIAVSKRDADAFRSEYGVTAVDTINTGVDLDYFTFAPPPASDTCVFMGSMDWLANVDGIEFFMDEVWPLVVRDRPAAKMLVIGRSPPAALVARARERRLDWEFTGFVDDVRPWVRKGAVSVIPLRVGGGTRLKAFEAMALGCPVVSTDIGVEGLPVEPDTHFIAANDARTFADAVVALLADHRRATSIAAEARGFVEGNFSHLSVAREFERICAAAAARSTDPARG